MSDKQKYPMNPDPDIDRIRKIVEFTLPKVTTPIINKDDAGEYVGKIGMCIETLKIIASEVGGIE